MVALPNHNSPISEAEYLSYERAADTKHEFRDAEIVAMAGASRKHSLIASYTNAALINLLGDKPCEVYQSDMRIKVQASGEHYYPDLSVVCGEAKFLDEIFDTLLNPILIIEVLSPSTERTDRGRKFRDYKTIATCHEYILISQDEARIERFLRQEDGNWLYTDVNGIDQHLRLSSLDVSLALADVYKKISFESDDDN